MELVLPSVEYKDSYIEAVKEFQADTDTSPRTERYKKVSIVDLEADFESFVAKELSHARGENMPEGWVPHTAYWLVDGKEFVGRIDIRHRLTPQLEKTGGHIGYDIRPSKRGRGYGTAMLALALPKARELGITRALVVCSTTNVASRTIIEKNGGVYQDSVVNTDIGETLRRFWIANHEKNPLS